MPTVSRVLAIVTVAAISLFPAGSQAINEVPWLWAAFCGHLSDGGAFQPAVARIASPDTPAAPCGPAPTAYHRVQSTTGDGDLTVPLSVGADPAGSTLCYVYNSVPEAPVIRMQRGHILTIRLTNTLHDTGPFTTQNCLLQTFVDGGACAEPEQGFRAQPGQDGVFLSDRDQCSASR